jgi:hypothetical protein
LTIHLLALFFISSSFVYIFFHQIMNGSSESGSQVGKLCGRTLPDPVFLNASSAYLLFVTDSSVQHPGYFITWLSTTNGKLFCCCFFSWLFALGAINIFGLL